MPRCDWPIPPVKALLLLLLQVLKLLLLLSIHLLLLNLRQNIVLIGREPVCAAVAVRQSQIRTRGR